MKLISFFYFKEYCSEYSEDSYDIGKPACGHSGHETTKNFMYDGEKFKYHPCMEKYCPVFELLDDPKGSKK